MRIETVVAFPSDKRDLILKLVISRGLPFIERDYTCREYNPTTSEIRKET